MLKVIQARKRPEIQCLSQICTDIVESTAKVDYILTVVQRCWVEDYTHVTNDGLEFLDSPGTQGTKLVSNNYS